MKTGQYCTKTILHAGKNYTKTKFHEGSTLHENKFARGEEIARRQLFTKDLFCTVNKNNC